MAFVSSGTGSQEAIAMLCDICEEEEEVNWFCKDCGQSMCNRCKKFHLRTANSRHHELLSLFEGLVIGKRNVQNMCDDHTEVFSFHCRTCKRNICAKCLSHNHEKHDFVAMQEVQGEDQKLTDDLKQKGEEMETIAQKIDSLLRHKKDFHSYIASCYTSIDENVQAIKDCAESEEKKLKSRLAAIEEKKNREIDETEKILRTQNDSYAKKISDIDRELRMQNNITLPVSAEKSQSELLAMAPTLAKSSTDFAFFSKGKINPEHIRDMIGRIDKELETVSLTLGQNSSDVCIPVLKNKINVVRSIGNKEIFPVEIQSVCSSRDGNIWVGCHGEVLKVDMDGKVLTRIGTRKSYYCGYIACFSTGDAIVSYSYDSHIDRFTTGGRMVEFADMSPSETCDIAVNDENQVVVSVNGNSLVIFTEQGDKLREIKPDVKPFYLFCLLQDGSYKIVEDESSDLVTIDMNGKITRRQEISAFDIYHITCDHHGNVIVSSLEDTIYVINEDGEIVRTYQIPGKEIYKFAVDNNDHLLMVTDWQTVTVAEYTE